jgi:arylsulfatase A-like enzyme
MTAPRARRARRKPPNLILIGVDSLRADHMSLYGYPRLTTPHMDRLAREGTVFENAFSPHIPTTPGYGSMMTGRDCFGTGVVSLRHRGPIAEGVPTLAEILRGEGYETSAVGIGDNPAGRGFDRYLEFEATGKWADGRCPKAGRMNAVALPELRRLAAAGRPFFLFLRPMDPHSPYLPPAPFERMFYAGNECDPGNTSMEPVFAFAPLRDYQRSWTPPGVTDKDYVIAQYDGAVAYMDACFRSIFAQVSALGRDEDTLIVLDSDHGETLYEHDCYFDHHGLYECTLRVPLVFRMPGRVPAGLRLSGNATLADVTPTILDILGIGTALEFDGQSLFPEMGGARRVPAAEFYITECTWMRKHGWRTPEWKLICALEPDFHFKPEVELYSLTEDPEELHNLAEGEPEVAAMLEERMQAWIARRERETGRPNPMYTNLHWHGLADVPGPFRSSQQAYDRLRVGALARRDEADEQKRMLAALGYL